MIGPAVVKNHLIEIMRILALQAGDKIMEIFNSGDFDVRKKNDASPVTVADEAADALISAGLKKHFPKIALVTEEQATSHAKAHSTFLIVDPLDGTKEFINRRDEFTVNIALVENGIPTLGIVYAPAINRLFYTLTVETAVEELAPFSQTKFGEQRRLHLAKPDNNSLIVVASKSHRDQETDDYISNYRIKDRKSAGSSLKFCLLAAGEADFYPRLGRTMEWDTAAGDAVLRAAGGKVVNFETHEPLTYGKIGYKNPFFIASADGVKLVVVNKN
jgi:3'(2'), 5'-bisphosphate nucleotidase